ncbi:beta-N-acetylhexosaminidase [uncultured Deefgea sp.]|uniref:beta-N-acetylhexosaminidase n=1 Tax=uncultured Deefgea sp. TaxID=1304914 RepID=UPI0025998657|nr:beta-N-acetylhexosaminidase [uncultured Deefgea sp.]
MSIAVSHAQLREQIGQLLMVGFDGLVVNPEIENLIRQQRIGGIILFRRNIDTPAQVAALCQQLQMINAQVSDLPLLIGIDQEGGMVMRIEEGVTPMPSAMAYARAATSPAQQANAIEACQALHQIAADELRQMGININFAPCLDINNNRANPVIGIRSFGEDAATVTQYGLAALRGIHAAGIAATAKHFPGHGDTATDSHYALPLVAHDLARLNAVELVPFKAAIAAGVDAVMTAHVVFAAIEPDTTLPATLSRKVLSGLLRQQLGFGGLIITDCLEMDAIAARPRVSDCPGAAGSVQGAVQAIAAGADIALVSHTYLRQVAAVDALLEAVEKGYINVDQIQQSLDRITLLKKSKAMTQWRDLVQPPAQLQAPAAMALAQQVQAQAIEMHGLPLDQHASTLLVTVELMQRTEIDEVALGASRSARGTLLPLLQAAGVDVSEIIISPQVNDSEWAQVLTAQASAQQVIFQSYNATRFARQSELIRQIAADKLLLIAGRNPYDIDIAPQAKTRIAACSNRPAVLALMAKKLLGDLE